MNDRYDLARDWLHVANANSGPARWEALANVDYLLGRLNLDQARQAGLQVTAAGSGADADATLLEGKRA